MVAQKRGMFLAGVALEMHSIDMPALLWWG